MSKLGHKLLREVGDAGTKGKQSRSNCAAIKVSQFLFKGHT